MYGCMTATCSRYYRDKNINLEVKKAMALYVATLISKQWEDLKVLPRQYIHKPYN